MIESHVEQVSSRPTVDLVAPDRKHLRPADRPLPLATVTAWRLAIVAALLVVWQYLPQVGYLSQRYRLLNPFFISSPQRVYQRLSYLSTGSHGYPSVWPYLWHTVSATLVGATIGLAIGTTLGLVFSNSPALSQVLSPFVYFFNSIPRIALIPVVVLLVGPTMRASEISCALVVTFLTFYNAFEGGRSVPSQILQNVEIFGAKKWQVAYYVRARYVLIWTFAAVPNAIAFGLIAVVATELIAGIQGMGYLIQAATTNVDASLSFAVVALLAVVGTALVTLAEMVKRRVLHWNQ
jgi:NitT/TauT family transport system permease protein